LMPRNQCDWPQTIGAKRLFHHCKFSGQKHFAHPVYIKILHTSVSVSAYI
jgi:hypothetical protein